MNIISAVNALIEKQTIIKVTDNDHWLYEPIGVVLDELVAYKRALELLAKDYCESMGCSFCDHRAKCLEVNHFEDVEGKEFLQKMFINKAREDLNNGEN